MLIAEMQIFRPGLLEIRKKTCINQCIVTTVPVVLEDLKAVDVQQANDREVLVGVVLEQKHSNALTFTS